MSIPLPPLPTPNYIKAHHMTSEALRARDQEIVRCVLQAAAKTTADYWDGRQEKLWAELCAAVIKALEFHHE